MHSQANIVSFDAARRRAAAQQRGASSRPASVRGARSSFRDDGVVSEVRFREGSRAASTVSSVRSGRGAAAGAGRSFGDARAARTASALGGEGHSARSIARAARPGVGGIARDPFAAGSASRGQRGSAPRAAVERFDEEEPTASSKGGLVGRLREGRRARTKERAGKAYFRQYEAGKPSEASQGGPRAAVYKTEMGSAHKRSSRMQNEASGSGTNRRGFAMASAKRSKLRVPLMALGACALCVAFAVAMLYGPAQQFYHDLRQKDRLAAEYTAVVERNEAISQQVDALQTEAGIEDRARMELGWVKEGEHAVSVSGLETERASTFRGNIVSDDIPYPDTWYSGIFDPLFGVSDEETAS